jgi:hypothetical protein
VRSHATHDTAKRSSRCQASARITERGEGTAAAISPRFSRASRSSFLLLVLVRRWSTRVAATIRAPLHPRRQLHRAGFYSWTTTEFSHAERRSSDRPHKSDLVPVALLPACVPVLVLPRRPLYPTSYVCQCHSCGVQPTKRRPPFRSKSASPRNPLENEGGMHLQLRRLREGQQLDAPSSSRIQHARRDTVRCCAASVGTLRQPVVHRCMRHVRDGHLPGASVMATHPQHA